MNIVKTLIFLLTLFWAMQHCAFAQIKGLWEITQVSVGSQEMTPVAKWTRFNYDGSYESGNGWLQNAAGTWELDESTNLMKMNETNGIKDPFGDFYIDIDSETMTWRRTEEGEEVTVNFKRIENLPQGPADLIVGLWSLESAEKEGVDLSKEFYAGRKRYFQIRWDRIYVDDLGPNGRQTGFWHMNGHRPTLTLLSHNPKAENEYWDVSFNKSKMFWFGKSDSLKDVRLTFNRIFEFPRE